MKYQLLLSLFLPALFLFISCSGTKKTTDQHTSKTSLDWSGTYFGIIPCSDCEGINTQIILNQDNNYIFKLQHSGNPDETLEFRGTFSWNQAGDKITLGGIDNTIYPIYYLVGENKLTQLDLAGNIIRSSNASMYVLHKQTVSIKNKYWKLIELNGKSIDNLSGFNKEPHIIFSFNENRVSGNAGCNSFNGNYELTGSNKLDISKIASTKMYCDKISVEEEFFNVLEISDSYQLIDEENMNLLYEGKVTAKFVAVYFR